MAIKMLCLIIEGGNNFPIHILGTCNFLSNITTNLTSSIKIIINEDLQNVLYLKANMRTATLHLHTNLFLGNINTPYFQKEKNFLS